LSFTERRRLHRRASRRQKLDQGEVCGVLVTNLARQLTLCFLTNQATAPGQFSISREQVLSARRQLRPGHKRVVGFFHSHPISPPILSPRDVAESPANSLQLVYDVCGRDIRLYRVSLVRGRRIVKDIPLLLLRQPRRSGAGQARSRGPGQRSDRPADGAHLRPERPPAGAHRRAPLG
jgi:proteasome lid subunit RPN8/RPN11